MTVTSLLVFRMMRAYWSLEAYVISTILAEMYMMGADNTVHRTREAAIWRETGVREYGRLKQVSVHEGAVVSIVSCITRAKNLT